MNTTFKQLLEITEIKSAQGRLEELDRFMDVTRGFSLKCNAHLRVLTNLVNNLVDSEDWLELGESPLRLPPPGAKSASQRRVANPSEAIAQSMKEDYERISKHIESGKQTSEFLKEMLEKLLKAVGSQPQVAATTQETRREDTVQVCSHRHCHASCLPGCIEPHNNGHHIGEARAGAAKGVFSELTEAAPRPPGPLHQPLASHSNPRTNLAESNLLLGRDASIDQLPRRKLSIQSDNKGFLSRQLPAGGRGDARVRELEAQLSESQTALKKLQAEVLSLRIQKDQLEESVRELISLPLVAAGSEPNSGREIGESFAPFYHSSLVERPSPIQPVESRSSYGLLASEKRSLRRI